MRCNRFFIMLVIVAVSAVFSGCQPNPEINTVTSKNDGAFEAALENAATEIPNEVGAAQTYQASFTSADGTITYTVNAELPAAAGTGPVIQVTPHEITTDEARAIAQVLFDGADMYEYSEEMSKSELEESILYLERKLSDYDTLLEYYGGNREMTDIIVSMYTAQIAGYKEKYENSEDAVEPQLCHWEFYPETHYTAVGTSGSEYIMAMTMLDGIPYRYRVCNRNEADYRIHSVFAFPDQTKINLDTIYSTQKPSESDITALCIQAQEMLKAMGLEDWYISSSSVMNMELGDGRIGYTVVIKAAPSYEGIKVVPQEQIASLKSDDAHASNYYYEVVEMDFTGGLLTFFEYQAPVDVVSVVNDGVMLLTAGEIVDTFENYMTLDDIATYQIPGIPDEVAETQQISRVEAIVDTVEFGLTRIRIKNNESDFYLVPAYTFKGTYVAYNGVGEAGMKMETTFAVINAVDGTIINTDLGY